MILFWSLPRHPQMVCWEWDDLYQNVKPQIFVGSSWYFLHKCEGPSLAQKIGGEALKVATFRWPPFRPGEKVLHTDTSPIYGKYSGCIGQYGVILWEQLRPVPKFSL